MAQPLSLFRGESAAGNVKAAGNEAMAGHGMGPSSPTVEEFRAIVAVFIERFAQADGSVYLGSIVVRKEQVQSELETIHQRTPDWEIAL